VDVRIGALDAYFCDAYTDVVAAAIISKNRQHNITLPEWFYDIQASLRAILEDYKNENWRWRMAAQKMMERENVSVFPPFRIYSTSLSQDHRFFGTFWTDGSSMSTRETAFRCKPHQRTLR